MSTAPIKLLLKPRTNINVISYQIISQIVTYMQNEHLSHMVDNLDDMRGTGTTLVSLLIPEGSQISLFRQHVVKEMSEATNIKSRQTRQGVQRALRSVKSSLDGLKTGPHGFAIYAGLATAKGGGTYFV